MLLDVISIKKESTEPRLMDLFLANRTKTNAELGEGCNIEYISNKCLFEVQYNKFYTSLLQILQMCACCTKHKKIVRNI